MARPFVRLLSAGSNERYSLQTDPHTLLELNETITNFIRDIPPNELSHVLTNKMRVYKHVGKISIICCNLRKYETCICIIAQELSKYTRRL
jgi:hypothetical protein